MPTTTVITAGGWWEVDHELFYMAGEDPADEGHLDVMIGASVRISFHFDSIAKGDKVGVIQFINPISQDFGDYHRRKTASGWALDKPIAIPAGQEQVERQCLTLYGVDLQGKPSRRGFVPIGGTLLAAVDGKHCMGYAEWDKDVLKPRSKTAWMEDEPREHYRLKGTFRQKQTEFYNLAYNVKSGMYLGKPITWGYRLMDADALGATNPSFDAPKAVGGDGKVPEALIAALKVYLNNYPRPKAANR
jgi:hypothetical protein